MKYRVQFNAVFKNSDANKILNHIEQIKKKAFMPLGSTEVEIILSTKKSEYVSNSQYPVNIYSQVDFNLSPKNHGDIPQGILEFEVSVDISFEIEQDSFDLLNYIESIKSLALTTDNQLRLCRFFECMHEEFPLRNDGSYSYIDFSGSVITHQ